MATKPPNCHIIAGIYLAAKHDPVQGQKQDLLNDPNAHLLRGALKRAQDGLGFADARGPSSKRTKSATAAPNAGAADDTTSVTSSSSSTVNPPTKRTKTDSVAGRPLIPKTKGLGPHLTLENLWPSAYTKLKRAPDNSPAYF